MKRAALLALALAAGPASAADPRTAGNTLLELIDARSVGMGESGVAVRGEAGGAAINPALASTYQGSQFSSQFQTAPGDVKTGFLAYGRSGPAFGWTAAAAFLDAGDIDVVPFSGPAVTVSAQRDFVGSLAGSFILGDRLRLGGAVKGIRSTLAEDHSATSGAFDAGLLFTITPMITLGLSGQNMGGELKYISVADPLPERYRAGLAVQFPEDDQTARDGQMPWYMRQYQDQSFYTFTAEAVADRWGKTVAHAGFEWDRTRLAVLRLGGQFGDDDDTSFSGGVGFWIQGWRFDYAYQWVDDLQDKHRVTLSYFWRDASAQKRESPMDRRFTLQKSKKQAAPKRRGITPF